MTIPPAVIDIPKLLESVGSLLWPLIVMFFLLAFRPAVAAIIASARSRKFTLKIGGQELTMEEANEQHEKLIADLQSQVLEIRKSLEAQSASPLRAQTPAAEAASARQTKTILWVDDNPKNNSYSVQRLTDLNIRVDIAQSTSEALARFAPDRYAYVISDMGRQEDGVYNPDAGVDLLKAIRERDKDVPFIIFSSPRATAAFGPAARALGATALTSSTTELFGILGIDPSKS